MEAVTDYLREVSVLGNFAGDLWVVVGGYGLLLSNLGLTLVHTSQERAGRLWRYFGHIEGVRISDAVGTLIFFVALTLILWGLGIGGITGRCPISQVVLPKELALAGIGALIGGRLSDALHSHLRLGRRYQRYANNPGLRSVPLCLAEAAVLTIVFAPGIASSPATAAAAGLGFGAGWLLFASIRPGLRALRSFERLRQERWLPEPG